MTWLEEVIAESLDCYSKYQCYHCREVILQLLDYDPTADQLSSIFSTIVRVFTVQIENVCLPSVKLDKQAKIGDAVATRTLAAMAGIPMPPAMPTVQRLYDGDSQPSNDSKDKSKPYESALRFLVRQMHLLLTYTENLAQFSEFLAPEMMASLSWKFLTVKGLPVLMSLLQDEITEHVSATLLLQVECIELININLFLFDRTSIFAFECAKFPWF